MNIISELKKYGDLFNEEPLRSILVPLTAREGLEDKFLGEQRVFYYTKDSRSMRGYTFNLTEEVAFKIVKFPHTRNFFNHPWCFGFIKRKTENGYVWKGAYAGRHGELFSKIKKVVRSTDDNPELLAKVNFPRAITRTDIFRDFEMGDFIKEVYQDLGDTTEWDSLDGLVGLESYIRNIIYIARDRALFQKERQPEFFLEKVDSGYSLIFNSGLFDKYLNFIVLKADMSLRNNGTLSEPYYSVNSLSRVDNLSQYVLDEPPEVIQLCDKSDLLFSQDKVYLSDRRALDHIFTERTDRMPEDIQDYPLEVLNSSLKSSIDLALKRHKIDMHHFVPFLNMKWNKISYLIPFYVNSSEEDEPACAIVISEIKPGRWAPVTILQMETARSNARLLSRLNSSWLINTKGGIRNENCKA
ncbi:DUF3825 domain-containing protein [Lysinibacillus xylanilyticus]|uniref:DUF3825 domain-containing protein n=1 Tax=Lysinibacillus xylanilyticus TaxID=582475 RepID=UPI0036D8159D